MVEQSEEEKVNNSSSYISGMWFSESCTVPKDIIEFDYSFGYNCKKLFNLCLITDNVLVFSSGNYIHYYHIATKELKYRRSASGGGIGFILKNPNPKLNYLTICENGNNPLIIIYNYPSNDIIATLEGGADSSYTCAKYRPDGELLATQSGEPDYMITIWNWKESKIILRCQSYQNDVLNVLFSPYNSILLTTCGLGHIKFWKMAKTFTGLKLQGDPGRFGKTEITDIYTIYMLPDEKVISSCEWGNLLLWDAGLIKLEVCRKNRKPCHNGPITFLNMDNGELMTASLDGYVRVWFWETVELSNPPDDDRFVEIEPIYEFRIGDDNRLCEIRDLIKIKIYDPQDCSYYVQDGKGGIWICWLDKNNIPETPRLIYSCHGGEIMSADTSPISPHITTIGAEGRLHFYNYEKKELQFTKQFTYPGSDLVWLPTVLDSSGCVIIVGFEDGIIREFVIEFDSNLTTVKNIHLIDVIKPHNKAITKITTNLKKGILISGAKDYTIFVHAIIKDGESYVKLLPIGFVKLTSVPTAFNWDDVDKKLLIGTNSGEIFETDLPNEPGDTEITYALFDIRIKKATFKSVKSKIRRDIRLREKEKKKAAKRQKKVDELMKSKELSPGMETDLNIISGREDSEEEEEEPPLYYPPKPNSIFWLKYTPTETVWISVAGYDAGYIYEIDFDKDEPEKSTMVVDGDDTEIYCCELIDEYSVFATQNGLLRINSIKPNNFLDLTDYCLLGVHDNKIARVSKICKSWDGKKIFTCGYDGNIFSFQWNGSVMHESLTSKTDYIPPNVVKDIEDINYPSLEEQKIKAEEDKKMKIRNDRKEKMLGVAAIYRFQFKDVIRRNKMIAPSQQYKDEELDLDERITNNLKSTRKKKVMDYFITPLEHMPFEIQGIGNELKFLRSETVVKSFRIKKLSPEIEDIKKEIDKRLLLLGDSTSAMDLYETEKSFDISMPDPPEETFFLGLNPDDIIPKFPPKMLRLLERYRERKQHQMLRYVDWEKMNHKKPNPNKNHIDDIKSIAEAERSIGDYKLKTDPEYEPKSYDNVLNKYKELLRAREMLYKNKKEFNKKLYELRKRKNKLYKLIKSKTEEIKLIHMYIPEKKKRNLPKINDIDFTKEYPGDSLIEHVKPGTGIEISDLFKDEKISSSLINTSSLIDLTLLKETMTEEDQTENFRRIVIDISEVKSISKIDSIMNDSPTCLEFSDIIKYSSTSDTPWELEMKYQMVINKIIEQDEIISEVTYKIKEFDDNLLELGESKLQIEVDSKFLEIYLITLNEELVILKDCEKLENELSSKALKAMSERNTLKTYIDGLAKNIDSIKKQYDKMNDQIRQISNNFMGLIKGNKFCDFLRRIFKKKCRSRKKAVTNNNESQSDSSSESSIEERNDESLSSFDIIPTRLDENVCPPGCDRKLYDLAFKLRNERHDLEEAIHVQSKLRDEKQKELNDRRTALTISESVFAKERKKLTDFRRQKQALLNKISTVVIVQMDQLQYLKEKENINNIPKTLLFSSDNVFQLYSRVGQLDLETLETKRIHRINIIHLTRMTTDCKYMNRQIHLLQEKIQQAMFRKFGCQLDVNQLEEETLRRFIFQLQTTLDEERKVIMGHVEEKKKQLIELEKTLNREIQLGAEKYNILTILQEEKNILREVLILQNKNFEKQTIRTSPDFRQDLQKLKDVERHQKNRIESLEKEIRSLRFKTRPLQVHPKDGEEPLQPDSTVEILPPDDLLNDDERLFKNIESIMPTTHLYGPDVFTIDKIKRIVHTFMIRNFSKQIMPEDSMRKYIEKISKFLGYVAKNFECDDMEKVMECIVEQFQNIVPKKYLLHVQPQQIKDLFNEVVSVFRYEKIEINVEEVIVGIVSNSMQIVQHSRPKPSNFTQAWLVEIFKEMIEVLTVGDLKRSQTVNKLSELLLNYSTFIPKSIDLHNLVNDVLEYARSSLLDEFTQHPIKEFAELLYRKLNNPIKSEKS
ncbi:cilia- and flagella-associated protein 44 [Condylostylus longicornis]|uniref:cilia- and flagella-associated protein 44 n=1 Tax=Condylostylus longicornis TaxID=2530218 RepID=UPI00244E058A|nr:cilia- and flagella-associated protein 44 [Condylostylus longicornis]